MKRVNERLKDIHSWLLPGNCLLCMARVNGGQTLCAACERSLPRLARACPRCAAVSGAVEIGVACGVCQKHPPAYAHARAAFSYAAPVDRLIQNLKYHQRLELSRVLGEYLAAYVAQLNDPAPDIVVPVPLHPSRLRVRGYNQSLEIARFVAPPLGLPLDYRHLRRIRATAPQTELPRPLRRKNVRGAFEADATFAGKRVAIVDDVMTSGHTVNALANCLLKSGAAEVVVWVVARA